MRLLLNKRIRMDLPKKDFTGCFEVIDSLNSTKAIQVKGHDFIEPVNKFYKSERGYSFEFMRDRFVALNEQDYPYCLGEYKFNNIKYNFSADKEGSFIENHDTDGFTYTKIVVKFSSFTTDGLMDGNYHWLFLMPIENKERLVFEDYEHSKYRWPGKRDGEMIETPLERGEAHIGHVLNGPQMYVFFDFIFRCNSAQAQNYSYSAAVALGLLSGNVYLNEAYEFAFADNGYDKLLGMRYHSLAPSFKFQYNLFTTRIYNIMPSIIKRTYGKEGENRMCRYLNRLRKRGFEINLFPREVLGKLIDQFAGNESLCRAAYILMQGTQSTMELQPAVGSVALETITNVFKNPPESNEGSVVPPEQWKKIDECLKKSLKDNFEIEKDKRELLENHIDNLNKTTNKQKLSGPFEKFHYELSSDEADVIELRNKFLHGSIATDSIGNFEKAFDDLQYYTLMMERLCGILLLKNAGYKGYIINQVKLYYPKRSKHAFISLEDKKE